MLRHARGMSRRERSAGRSAKRKYDDLVRSWRRRKRKVFAVLGIFSGSVIVLSLVAADRWPSAAWTFGLFAGAALALWMIAFLSPPGWIDNWQTGAWGEQATAKALRKLQREGWVILHDLPAGRGNVDHIAIGPGGVYVLDSKQPGGSVDVDGDTATVRRYDDPDLSYRLTPSSTIGLARRTHHQVLAHSRINVWVNPVIVLWADFPQRVANGQCAYVHGGELAEWLLSRPPTIAPPRVPQIADAVRASFAPAAKT